MEIPLFKGTCPHPVPDDDESGYEVRRKKGGYGHVARLFVHDDSPVQLAVRGDGPHGGRLGGRAPAGHGGTGVDRALVDDAPTRPVPRAVLRVPRAVLRVLEGDERARRFHGKAGRPADGVTRDASMGGEPAHRPRYARTAAR
ncbi:hypothetical protein [Streptosporangium sp. NPDC002721]|uniref:hypothetical protein n=1 Tax=Streptosporangium sp. NPDC002721 TaxID=3366188 RepID=UPI003677455B